jgi:hypothetical protein
MSRILLKSFSVFTAIVLLFTQTLSLSARSTEPPLTSIDESVLTLDESALNEAMQELNELDEFLSENAGVTYTDLESAGSELIIGVENSTAPLGMPADSEAPLGIPSFLWGCILGVIGILLVYILTDGDKNQTRKALWGMLVWIGVWVVLYVGVFSATALWY